MSSLQKRIESEHLHWEKYTMRYIPDDEQSITTSSTPDSICSTKLHCRYDTRHLSRRSSTSSFATEFEPEPAQAFIAPRDFNGAPITVYASFEAAVAQSTQVLEQAQVEGQGESESLIQETGERGQQPRRLVTPGKLYENEEDDDEIVYD
ncbi:hypothetical protein GGS21DRAFT_407749 [Xylaria nigripes]|nr:hypothetical protein GGS21DRAFT_407749 [Xylaria nigripes]